MIRRKLVLPVDPDRLWQALTDPDEASTWLGGRIEWEVAPGGGLVFTPDTAPPGDGSARPAPVREGQVEVVRPGRYLRFRWWPRPDAGARPADGDEASEVSYLIEPDEGSSVLTVQETPLPALTVAALVRPGPARPTGAWTQRDDVQLRAYAGAAPLARAGVA